MRVEISSDMDYSYGYSVRRSANRKSGHLLGGQAYYSIMSICFASRRSTVKSDSSYSFQFNEMARPAGLEPAAYCLEGSYYKTPSAAAGVAYEEARHLSRP